MRSKQLIINFPKSYIYIYPDTQVYQINHTSTPAKDLVVRLLKYSILFLLLILLKTKEDRIRTSILSLIISL